MRFVKWRIFLWVAGSVVGAAIVAIPDSGERVFSLSKTHGPSPLDLVGVAALLVCWLPVAVVLPPLWRVAGTVAARLSAVLAAAGTAGLAITIGADLGWAWPIAASMLVAAQLIVIVSGWRRTGSALPASDAVGGAV